MLAPLMLRFDFTEIWYTMRVACENTRAFDRECAGVRDRNAPESDQLNTKCNRLRAIGYQADTESIRSYRNTEGTVLSYQYLMRRHW
jgi:hypothetical protein